LIGVDWGQNPEISKGYFGLETSAQSCHLTNQIFDFWESAFPLEFSWKKTGGNSFMGIKYPSPTKIVPGTPPLPITWKLTSLGSSLTWADPVRVPTATK
jgi:hypothetical protein